MLKAVADRIIVKLDPLTPSALIMVDSPINIRNSGVVQSVGDKVKTVTTGDHIIFHLFDELPLPEDGLVVIRENSVLGIYSDETH
ncbi:MAG: hypothetical protein VZR95_01020 [Alphaproteobacteria bacterium]